MEDVMDDRFAGVRAAAGEIYAVSYYGNIRAGTAVLIKLCSGVYAVTSVTVIEDNPGALFYLVLSSRKCRKTIPLKGPIFHYLDTSFLTTGAAAFMVDTEQGCIGSDDFTPLGTNSTYYSNYDTELKKLYIYGYASDKESGGTKPVLIKAKTYEWISTKGPTDKEDICSIRIGPEPHRITLADALYVEDEDEQYLDSLQGGLVFRFMKYGMEVSGIVLGEGEFSYYVNNVRSRPEKLLYFVRIHRVIEMLRFSFKF